VIVLSAADEGGALVLQALDAGAVEVVPKPTALATDKVFEVADRLVATVKAVAAAPVPPKPAAPGAAPKPAAAPRAGRHRRAGARRLDRRAAGAQAV
jgi:two-component system chemotaxis response regulator CheB